MRLSLINERNSISVQLELESFGYLKNTIVTDFDQITTDTHPELGMEEFHVTSVVWNVVRNSACTEAFAPNTIPVL